MIHVVDITMFIVMTCPLVACLATLALSGQKLRKRSHWPLVSAAWICLVGCVTLVLVVGSTSLLPQDSSRRVLMDWIRIENATPFLATLALRIDSLSAIFLLISTIVMVAAVHNAIKEIPLASRPQFYCLAGAGYAATVLLLMAENVLQFFFFWQLQNCCAAFLVAMRRDGSISLGDSKRVLLPVFIGDAVLAFGAGLAWFTFGSLEWNEILLRSRISELSSESSAAIATVCLCFFAGSIGKCAQFPLLNWNSRLATGYVSTNVLLHASIMMPAGIYLMVRISNLLEAAPDARLFVACVGGMTLLLTSIAALTTNNLARILTFVTSGQFGLMFMAIGAGGSQGMTSAVFLLVCVSGLLTALFLHIPALTQPRESTGRFGSNHWPFLCVAVIFFSGFWGQHAVLSATWSAANPTQTTSSAEGSLAGDRNPIDLTARSAQSPPRLLGVNASTIFGVLTGLILLSIFSTSFAAFRAFWRSTPAVDDDAPLHSVLDKRFPIALSALVVVLIPIWILSGQFEAGLARSVHLVKPASLFIAGIGIPVAMLGFVLAWMSRSWTPAQGGRLERTAEDFAQLADGSFCLNEVFRFVVLEPLRFLGRACEHINSTVIENWATGGIGRFLGSLARSGERLHIRVTAFYALAMMLSVAVLMAVLIWLRR